MNAEPVNETGGPGKVSGPAVRAMLREVAASVGVCTRPVSLRVQDHTSGLSRIVDVPCGATTEATCAACAARWVSLRSRQCSEGWHLAGEPVVQASEITEEQRALVTERADLAYVRELAAQAGLPTDVADEHLAEVDRALADSGMRGRLPASDAAPRARRSRSTKRRADSADLPRRSVDPRTVGAVFGPRGFRPSLFVTLTLPSYGRVDSTGTPVDAERYDYRRAVRDAVHLGKVFDRFVQNLRRVVGWDVQYFAVVEAQRRGASHIHLALRGTVSRRELRQVAAATYHQVWWPPCDEAEFPTTRPPVWDAATAGYVDPDTGEVLPTWDEALDAIDADPNAGPVHVARFGTQVDAQGVLAGTPEAGRRVRYLTKYLTKNLGDTYWPGHAEDGDPAAREHLARLAEVARYEPCSPRCANWLRYGIQPKNPRAGMRPGSCAGRAHKPANLGYGGRRVLVSRKWNAKTLADHKQERRAFVLAVLATHETDQNTEDHARTHGRADVPQFGNPTDVDPDRYTWTRAGPGDPDVPPWETRISRAIAQRLAWRRAYQHATAA